MGNGRSVQAMGRRLRFDQVHRTHPDGHVYLASGMFRPLAYEDQVAGLRTVGEGHVYLVAFSSGSVKVGLASFPKKRLAQHIAGAACHGVEVLAAWVSGPHVEAEANERALISAARALGGTPRPYANNQVYPEWFTNVDLHDLKTHAETLTYTRARATTTRQRSTTKPIPVPRDNNYPHAHTQSDSHLGISIE